MKLLTLDFGGTFVKYALIDENAHFTEKGKDPAPLESLDQFLQYIADKADIYKKEIEGIAVSLPGVIDTERGFVYFAGRYTGIILLKDLGKILLLFFLAPFDAHALFPLPRGAFRGAWIIKLITVACALQAGC